MQGGNSPGSEDIPLGPECPIEGLEMNWVFGQNAPSTKASSANLARNPIVIGSDLKYDVF